MTFLRFFGLAALALGCVAGLATARGQEAEVRRQEAAARQARLDELADPQDPRVRLLLLTAGGPLVVEASFTIDRQPFRSLRKKMIDETIAAADTDLDGKSTWKEAFGNPHFLTGILFIEDEKERKTWLERLDTDSNGVVSRGEARRAMMRVYGSGSFSLQPYVVGQKIEKADVLNLLDRDNDGALSPAELLATEDRLKSRDANDDDLLELNEVTDLQFLNQYRLLMSSARAAPPGEVAIEFGAGSKPEELYAWLKKKYAPGGPLTAAQIPLVPNLFAWLDANQNGQWDPAEAARLLTAPAQVVLEGHFGKSGDLPLGLRLKSLSDELGPAEKRVERMGGAVVLKFPGLKLEFLEHPQNTTPAMESSNEVFARFDGNRDGSLERKELVDGLGRSFTYWDRNADGKVLPAEIDLFHAKSVEPDLSRIGSSVGEIGVSTFRALDASSDGRLSLREMRQAGERLKSYDANADGTISPNEIPLTMSVTFGQGSFSSRRPVSRRRGADWLARMDRNGDGDVTLREFLGSSEQFRKLDVDGDGFLTIEEVLGVPEPKAESR